MKRFVVATAALTLVTAVCADSAAGETTTTEPTDTTTTVVETTEPSGPAVSPAAGFQTEIDKAAPPDVRVEFRSGDAEVRIEARWENGGLEVKVSG